MTELPLRWRASGNPECPFCRVEMRYTPPVGVGDIDGWICPNYDVDDEDEYGRGCCFRLFRDEVRRR